MRQEGTSELYDEAEEAESPHHVQVPSSSSPSRLMGNGGSQLKRRLHVRVGASAIKAATQTMSRSSPPRFSVPAAAASGAPPSGGPQFSYPTNEDMQIARSSFLQLAAAVEAAAKSKSVSSAVEALKWSLKGLQDVARLLLVLMQQQQRCRVLLSQAVWSAAAAKVAAACNSYISEFLPQMLLLYTAEVQLQQQQEQPPMQQQTQQQMQQQMQQMQHMLQLSRELQLLQLDLMQKLLHQEPRTAPLCAEAVARILDMHRGVWGTSSSTQSSRLAVVTAAYDLLQACGSAMLQETLAAAGRLSSSGTAAVLEYIGGASACTRGFAALNSIRSQVHDSLLRLPLLLAPAAAAAAAAADSAAPSLSEEQLNQQTRAAAAARCMRSCLSVISSWAEVLHAAAQQTHSAAAAASKGQQQRQQLSLTSDTASMHAEQLLRDTAAAWAEADSQLLLQLLLQLPHTHAEASSAHAAPTSSGSLDTPAAAHDSPGNGESWNSSAPAAPARGAINPLVYGEVLQTVTWICSRVPQQLRYFLHPLIQTAEVLRKTHQRAAAAGAASASPKAADSSMLSDTWPAGVPAAPDGKGCGVHCAAEAAVACGGAEAVHALLLLLQREGLRLLASPRCTPTAGLLLIEAAGRKASARLLQREATAEFQAMWIQNEEGRRSCSSLAGTAAAATEGALSKKRRVAASLASQIGVNSISVPAELSVDADTTAARAVAAACSAMAAASRVVVVAETDRGAWRAEEQQVDATSLLVEAYNPQRLTSLLIQGLQRSSSGSSNSGVAARACAPVMDLLQAAEAKIRQGDSSNHRAHESAAAQGSSRGKGQISLPSLFEGSLPEEDLEAEGSNSDHACEFPHLVHPAESYMKLLAAQVLSSPLPERLAGSNAYADRLSFLQWRQQLFLRLVERTAEPMRIWARVLQCMHAFCPSGCSPLKAFRASEAVVWQRVRSMPRQHCHRNAFTGAAADAAFSRVKDDAFKVSLQTPLFVLQTHLALALDLLFFLSSRSCKSHLQSKHQQASTAVLAAGSSPLTCSLLGKLPEGVEGWDSWSLSRSSHSLSPMSDYEKAFGECISKAYCQELLDDTSLRAAYSQLIGRFLVAAPLVPPSAFALLAWLADGPPPAAVVAAAAAGAALEKQQQPAETNASTTTDTGDKAATTTAMQICEQEQEQQLQQQNSYAGYLAAACGLSESRSGKALANDRRLVVAAISQVIRRKNAPISRRSAFTLLMRLCHVGSPGCRRLFSRLFASAKGTYTPPKDAWQHQRLRDILLQSTISEAAAAAAAMDEAAAAQSAIKCPAGTQLWQMPALLLHQAGLTTTTATTGTSTQEQQQQQRDDGVAVTPAAVAAAAAADVAAAEGASGSAVSAEELHGWGSPEVFSGRWVEEVASLIYASSGGRKAVESLTALMRVNAFPAAVAATVLRDVAAAADAGEKAAAAVAVSWAAKEAAEAVDGGAGASSVAAEKSAAAPGGEEAGAAAAAAAAALTKAKAAAAAAAFDMRSGVFAVIAARNPFLLHLLLRVAVFCTDTAMFKHHEQLLLQAKSPRGTNCDGAVCFCAAGAGADRRADQRFTPPGVSAAN
ncbi:uncharacterized protein LOC34617553 [Cyclospora cayetanensis]|uniref:Uncharacterized protein LOC34617553 n=1 Tax=Cyclospora cayetanensis TaxID=88456 RepID=A0A6P6RYC4_9EIME|nr:uncharacterized protein LOC34617553 [Cyclospora cayetanensis]